MNENYKNEIAANNSVADIPCDQEALEERKSHEPVAAGELITATPLFANVQDYTVTIDAEAETVEAKTPEAETVKRERDDIPGKPNYNWKKYGYTLITEDTFSGGPHPGDYEKDGVLHCGYCHKPKYILHELFGKVQAFPIDCDCMRECQHRIAEQRRQRQFLIRVDDCRRHALPYSHMHKWTFANDDGGSPRILHYAQYYVKNFAAMKEKGEGLFLIGVTGTGKTFTAVEIVNALCDRGYRCIMVSLLEIVLELLSMNREKRLQYIDELCRHDLVVLDGYGTEPSTYFSDMNILEIVEICYNRHVPMIVTTTLNLDDLTGLNPTRRTIVSRIRERCYSLTLANIKRRNKMTADRQNRFRELLDIQEAPESTRRSKTKGSREKKLMPDLYESCEDMVLIHDSAASKADFE